MSIMKNRPAHEVRLGSVKAVVWRNDTETGARYNTTFIRLYKEGEKWKTTQSFGRDDLLLVAKAADQAHTWILANLQGIELPAKGSWEHLAQPALDEA